VAAGPGWADGLVLLGSADGVEALISDIMASDHASGCDVDVLQGVRMAFL
jgi:hypothetical protein